MYGVVHFTTGSLNMPIDKSDPNPNQSKASKFRWGELEEDDNLDFLLPPKEVIGPDENGIKKVIEYKFNDEGNKVKITTTTRVRKLAKARLNKRAVERRNWEKFGDAVHEDVGSRLTMVSTEEIILERPRAPGLILDSHSLPFSFIIVFISSRFDEWDGNGLCAFGYLSIFDLLFAGISNSDILSMKAEEIKVTGDSLAQLSKGGAVLMVCRTCGKKGDHWTSKCPYKDLAAPVETFVDKPVASEASVAASGSGKGAYVPPSMRAGAERTAGSDMRRRNDENSVRVTNLSEDTREPDLLELFRPFGAVTRVYVAMDQKTGTSRGFGFVNFVNREDAQRAINKLNGYGYDNLILRVEWATPRAN
ncbi:hypothetical protein Golax_004224 [Gossypium laxum]|uniref:Eukaryotic translation initiation factor 3 subunit G n=1 Tax=Gossypium laxum TaxID=34288 RepID=A0A7J9AHU6_9ROSI|nr:hypothetical protein [Gossypium laxum]